MGRHRSAGNESDVRRKYRALLDESHHRFPRKDVLSHAIGWYLDGHLVAKPLVAAYAYANFAEYLLHHTRFGRNHSESVVYEIEAFYALTRRTLQNILSTYPIGRRLRPCEREAASRTVGQVFDAAKSVYESVQRANTKCACPVCSGHKVFPADVELLEAILCEQSRLGNIPPTSALFRASAVDKLPRTVV